MKTRRVDVSLTTNGEGFQLLGYDMEAIATKLRDLGATGIFLEIVSFRKNIQETEMVCGDTLLVRFKGDSGPGVMALCNKSLGLPQPDEIDLDKNMWYRFWWD